MGRTNVRIALTAPCRRQQYHPNVNQSKVHRVMRRYDKKSRNKTKLSNSPSENNNEISPSFTKTASETSHVMDPQEVHVPTQEEARKLQDKCSIMKKKRKFPRTMKRSIKLFSLSIIVLISLTYELYLSNNQAAKPTTSSHSFMIPSILQYVEASLIVGDSAIEIQEVGPNEDKEPITTVRHHEIHHQSDPIQANQVIFGSSNGAIATLDSHLIQVEHREQPKRSGFIQMPSPLPPLGSEEIHKSTEDITDGDKKSRKGHDYDINEFNVSQRQPETKALNEVLTVPKVEPFGSQQTKKDKEDESGTTDKSITGKVVDFELTPAGGHNKAKIKMKKKKKKEDEMYKKWGKKKMAEKKAIDLEHKEHMKKKKAEGHKGKKKWGKEVHGMKKKGKFKKKKWGKKVKKGKGIKKGRKGKKFLKDVGHKDTGFKTVYHKEEWGKSSKWHDIKRQKKWDHKDKKWKKKWKKEKGKKYKGDHMKKFEKKKGAGKKYKKENKEKFKKFKKEKFEKGKKKKMEEKAKKKEGGAKKEMKKAMKKKKKKE